MVKVGDRIYWEDDGTKKLGVVTKYGEATSGYSRITVLEDGETKEEDLPLNKKVQVIVQSSLLREITEAGKNTVAYVALQKIFYHRDIFAKENARFLLSDLIYEILVKRHTVRITPFFGQMVSLTQNILDPKDFLNTVQKLPFTLLIDQILSMLMGKKFGHDILNETITHATSFYLTNVLDRKFLDRSDDGKYIYP